MDKIFAEKGCKKIVQNSQNYGNQVQYNSVGAPNMLVSFKSNQI